MPRWPQSVAQRRERARAQALRQAVAQLPPETVRAMREALESEELIAGAYADRRGRVCPMLAAHRRGARTGVGGFPRAWDAFTRARRPRPATERELAILRALLEEASFPSTTAPLPVPRAAGAPPVGAAP